MVIADIQRYVRGDICRHACSHTVQHMSWALWLLGLSIVQSCISQMYLSRCIVGKKSKAVALKMLSVLLSKNCSNLEASLEISYCCKEKSKNPKSELSFIGTGVYSKKWTPLQFILILFPLTSHSHSTVNRWWQGQGVIHGVGRLHCLNAGSPLGLFWPPTNCTCLRLSLMCTHTLHT